MRDLKTIAIIVVICVAVLWFYQASAITDVTPTMTPVFIGYANTTLEEQINHTYEIHYIGQGDKVYLGDHIDISGVVAGNLALAWWPGGEPVLDEAPQVITLPKSKSGWYDFYVDPAIFASRLGMWYKWNGYVESNGNTRAFWVSATWRNMTTTYQNGTIIEQPSLASGNYTPIVTPTQEILPEKPVSDYLAVHGQGFNITTAGPSKLWLFGRVDGLYDIAFPDNQASIDGHFIDSLEAGSYKILIQYPGANTIYEAFYDKNTQQIKSPWASVSPLNIAGISPALIVDSLEKYLDATDDKYTVYNLEVQNPLIQLMSMEQVSVGSAKEYYKSDDMRGNVSLFDVRGYTNVNPGTNLYFALDENRQAGHIRWFNTTAMATNVPGDMRPFQVYIPVYWDGITPGAHTISGYTDDGGSIYKDFFVRISEGTDSPVAQPTVKWADDRNPWIPTPTPITVIQTQQVIVTQTILVPVTPTDEQVRLQQEIVTGEVHQYYIYWGLLWTIVVVGLFLITRFMYRAYKRKQWMAR